MSRAAKRSGRKMNSKSASTHTFGSGQNPEGRSPIDYTAFSEGVPVEGRLSNGIEVDSTVRCPKCGRIGVITEEHRGWQRIVHRGFVHREILEGLDYCEVSARR